MRAAITAKLNMELVYQLQRLSMMGTILHVGAHPDDEDVGVMTYMARHHGVRTVYWSATRGEGGENRIGPYVGDALGLYRTWESLAVRDVAGGEAMYGPFYDFGLSTSGEDTLEKWGRGDLIREIVRTIRLVQPTIVVSRWSGKAEDKHGHHIAVGMVIQEAFDAAADPHRFTTLRLPAWQPQKLYYSARGDWTSIDRDSLGQVVPEYERAGFVRVNTGEFDPFAGRTYQEQAWIGFNNHTTQAMDCVPRPGNFYYYYALHKSLVPTPEREHDIFNGLDPTLTGLADHLGAPPDLRDSLDYIKTYALTAMEQYQLGRSIQAANALFVGLGEIRLLRQQFAAGPMNVTSWALNRYLARKEADFEAAAAQCLNLRLEGLSDCARVTPGQQFDVSAHVWNYGGISVDDATFTLHTPAGWEVKSLRPPEPQTPHLYATYSVTVSEAASLTTLYWLQHPHGPFAYVWDGAPWDGLPFGPHDVELSCRISVGGQVLTLREPVVLREGFAGGFRELPVAVVPPISLHTNTKKVSLPVSDQEQHLELRVVTQSNVEYNDIEGSLTLEAPPGWQVSPNRIDVALGDARTLTFSVSIPPTTAPGFYSLCYVIHCGGRDYDVLLEPVRMVAPGLPGMPDEANCIQEEFIMPRAEVSVHLVEAELV